LTACTGVATFLPQSYTLEKGAAKKILKGGDGEVAGVVFSAFEKTLSFVLTPKGASIAAAKSVAGAMPNAGTLLTLTDADDADRNGIWICDRARKAASNEGEMQFTIDAVQYPDANVQTAIS
jgi:hypothetical protein